MAKGMNLSKKLLLGSAALGAAGGAGAGGFMIGKRRGAERMATEMATAFSAANQRENAQLANYFFRKGLTAGQTGAATEKTAMDVIYHEGFMEEFEKGAAGINPKQLKSAWKSVKQFVRPATRKTLRMSRAGAAGIGAAGLAAGGALGSMSGKKNVEVTRYG